MKKLLGFYFILLCTYNSIYSAPTHINLPRSSSFWSRTLQVATSYGKAFLAAAQKAVSLHMAKNSIKNVGFIAAAAAVSYYGFKLAKRYFQQPHATIIEEAEKILKDLEPFNPLIEAYLRCDLATNTPIESIPEEILKELASAQEPTITDLDKLIASLERHSKILQERITQINQSTPTNKTFLERMSAIYQQIKQVLPILKSLKQIKSQRQDYFQAYASVHKAYILAVEAGNKYNGPLSFLAKEYGESFTGTEFASEEKLELFAEARGKDCNSSEFLTTLEGTTDNLQKVLKTLDGSTPYITIQGRKKDVDLFAQRLSALLQFMQININYFTLCDTIIAATQAYGDGTQPLHIPPTAYPHLTLVGRLNASLKDIDNAKTPIFVYGSPLYHKIYDFAQNLEKSLTQQRDDITGSPLYAEELREQEKAAREQEWLAIARKATEDANRLQQEQLLLQRKQLEVASRLQQEQRSLQRKQLHAQEKTNSLLLLDQKRAAKIITEEKYKSKARDIESSYSAQELTDNLFDQCGIQ